MSALTELNWTAIGAAAVAAFILGIVWFAPRVFGNYWAGLVSRYSGIPTRELNANAARPATLAKWFLVISVSAIALALVIDAAGAETPGEGAVLGLVLGIGIGVAFWSWPPIFALIPWRWWLVTSGSFVLMQVTMGAILTAWS
jgi:hypothetical protein